MMLDHLGEPAAAAAVPGAVETVFARGGDTLTPDMGGTDIEVVAAVEEW